MSQGGLGVRMNRRTFLRTVPALLGVPALMLGAACRAQAPNAPAASQGAAPSSQSAPAASATSPAAGQAAPAAQAPAAAPPTAAPPQLAATTTTSNAAAGTAATTGLMRPTDGTPKRGGTLRIAGGTTTSPHFDLHQGATVHSLSHTYNNLVRKDLTDGFRTIIPDLAVAWDVSPDKLSYTFRLRDGVKFHDGTPFTSADVVATFNRIMSPPQGIASVFRSQLEMVDRVEAPDPRTARFVLKHPSLVLMEVLSQPGMIVYSKKAIDENGGDLRKAVAPGTGAFIYKDYKAGEKWSFARNPEYWDKELPYVDALEMIDTPQLSDRGTAVLTGQADMTWNASVDTWKEGQTRKDAITAAQLPNFGAHTAHLNNEKGPLGDKRVRRAIHLAVSRQNIFKAYQNQEPIFLGRWMSYVSPGSPGLADIEKLPGYRADKSADLAEAKKLMADAGHPNGFGPIELLSATAPWAAEIMAPVFADELKRTLGIETKIRLIERSLLIEEYKKGSFDILVETQFACPIADFTIAWNDYMKTGAAKNWSRFSSKEFDGLLDKLNVEGDAGKQKALFQQGMDMLDQEMPFFVTGFTAHSPMWRNNVKGLALDKRVYSEWGRVETAWLDR
ncbi:MAG: ABC transporter substrate-binding protein [Chloroflexi bacterium]|nr:ABC transporter substrate-binding protein [Chloroflexota bacterium]